MSIRFMRINKYEPAADEKRLAEYAEKGEFITKHGLGLAYFRKGEPKKVRYCIEASMFRPGKKLRRIYEESGWRCTARGGDFNVYMSEDENAVPIHTDQSEYAHVIQKFNRTAMWLVIYGYIIILLCILCPFILFDFVSMGIIGSMAAGYMDIGLPDSAIVGNLILLFLMLPMVGFFLHDYTEAGKFIAGSIENGKSANRAVVFNNAAKIIFAALTIASVFLLVLLLGFRHSVASITEREIDNVPQQVITLDEVFGSERIVYLETDELADKYINPENKQDLRKGVKFSTIERTSSIFNPHYEYKQSAAYIPEGQEYGERIVLFGTHTEFENQWLAENGYDDCMQYKIVFYGTDSKERYPLDVTGTRFEKAYYFTESNRIYYILMDGNLVCTMMFSIPDNLKITPEELFELIGR